jgi:cytochrome c oxidase subunit 2
MNGRAKRDTIWRARRDRTPLQEPPAATAPKRGPRALRIALLPLLALLATGCTGEAAKWKRGGWPAPVTDRGVDALNIWEGFLLASLIIGGIVLFMIVYAAVAYRVRDDGHIPRQVRYNLPIEVLYTFLPIVVVSVLFYFTAVVETDVDKINDKSALQVQVVGFQWSWQFNYVDHGVSVTGRPGEPPVLVLPTDEQIHFHLTSPDVIHSFWVVPFLFKRDVIPGHPNEFELTITKAGTFAGRCTEFCGVHHDRMLFTVKAMKPSDYEAWLANAQRAAADGSNAEISTYTGGDHYKAPADGRNL